MNIRKDGISGDIHNLFERLRPDVDDLGAISEAALRDTQPGPQTRSRALHALIDSNPKYLRLIGSSVCLVAWLLDRSDAKDQGEPT